MARDPVNGISHNAVELACFLRPRGGADLFEQQGSGLCRAARLESGDEAAPRLADGALDVLPYVQSDATCERFATTLHLANQNREARRDALFDRVCVRHRPETAPLREACAEFGPNAEAGWRAATVSDLRADDLRRARSLQRNSWAAYASLTVLPLYGYLMWRLRRRVSGGAIGYAGIVVAGLLASSAIPGTGVPGVSDSLMTAIVVVPLCILLGPIAFLRSARIAVAVVTIVASAIGLIALGTTTMAEARMYAERAR
jgi:hypothetical protein